ncbi:hypothetical protein PU629_15140 [Pullulanibacillus sp. KACC 23026]|nr:hypothetical protein [Pullulanibacillus sp. KACC 23026]WEG11483.1 hypothetical protein PU629_15140 [Pullulanibacillus sp. KACC 23026]
MNEWKTEAEEAIQETDLKELIKNLEKHSTKHAGTAPAKIK